MNTDQLYSYVFRGLLTQEALEKTEAKTRIPMSAYLDEEVASRLSLDILDQDLVARARRMATVYTAIAAFENYVREFASKVLLEEAGENWWEENVSEGIRKKAEARREEESKIRWHTPRGDEPVNYTDFGDLISVISKNWDFFEVHLQSQEWMKQILKTLERSRNVIMHSGELGNEDIARIGSYIRDWVKQVGA